MAEKRKITDKGHYEDIPVAHGPGTLEIKDGESFEKVYILSSGGGTGCGLPSGNIIAGADSRINITLIILPGFSGDVPVTVDITGERADVNLSGLYLCGGDEKVTIRTEIRHRVPSCTSYQIFNGIASGNSDVKFYGKIVVAPDAQKTEAYQTNRNIIVSDGARAESKPQLEIYADDVKCSHGATVGQLNEDEQFYMRSRGIPEDEAKVLQMISFIAPVLSRISDGSVRSSLGTVIGDAVRKL